MLKTVLITTSLAAGLLMFDVAQPTLTGNYAEAAQHGGGRPAFRPAPRPAPRMARPPQRMARPAQRMARPAVRANVQRAHPSFARPKSNFGKPKFSFRPKAQPKFSATPKFTPKPLKQQVSPLQKKGGPGGFGKNTLPGQQKGPGGLSKGPGGMG